MTGFRKERKNLNVAQDAKDMIGKNKEAQIKMTSQTKTEYFGMKVKNSWFVGNLIIKMKEWKNAKCPICENCMRYEYNLANVWFFCEDINCRGYLKRTKSFRRNLWGDIEL